MFEDKREAYQKQGVLRYLQKLGYEYSEAFGLIQGYDVDPLRYRYNIPDEAVNQVWFKALGC